MQITLLATIALYKPLSVVKTYRLLDWNFVSMSCLATLLAAISSQAQTYSPAYDKSSYPSFSWDTVPKSIIFRNDQAISDDEVISVASNYHVAVLEKSNKQGLSYTEDGVKSLSARLKAVPDTDIKPLFYWNSHIRWGGYFANIEFDANEDEWANLITTNFSLYEQTNTDMAEWWVRTAMGVVPDANVDGIFVDAPWLQDGHSGALFINGVAQHPKVAMLQDLYNQLPADALSICNSAHHSYDAEWLAIFDGGYHEGWDSSDPDDTVTMIDEIRAALLNGKVMLPRSFPESGSYFTGVAEPSDTAEKFEWVEDHAEFPMAVFLMMAEPYAYMMYGEFAYAAYWYYWDTSDIELFNKPLGDPLADPVKNGYLYSRSFRYLDVWVNVETGAYEFDWKDSTSSNGSGTYQAEFAVNNFGARKSNTSAQNGAYIDGEAGFNLTFEVRANAGPADLDFRIKVPSGSRTMGVYLNDSFIGTVGTSSTSWTTQTVSANLLQGKNIVELRDSEGTLELDVDYLEVASSAAATYQAESDTELSGCGIKDIHSGFTGNGYVDMGGNGSWFEWDGVNVSSGTKTFTFTYAAASNRPCDITVNGTVVGQVSFPSTGAWTNWSTATIDVPLNSGYNTVRVTAATSAGGPNVDSLLITSIPTSIFASEDAYTRSGTFADDNFGTVDDLAVKASNSYLTRQSFIKFPVSGYSQASEVNLILTVNQLQSSGTGTVELRELSDDSWSEDSITWNNQPTQGNLLQSFTVLSSDVGNELSVDVTNYVTGEAAGDGTASFILVQPSGLDTYVGFSSSETTSGPYLEVE